MAEAKNAEEKSRPGQEYCQQVREWLNTVYQTNMLQLRMYTTFSQQLDWSALSNSPSNHGSFNFNSIPSPTNLSPPPPLFAPLPPMNRNVPLATPTTNNETPNTNVNNNPTTNTTLPSSVPTVNILEHRMYTLAPLWKRIVAEMIDFAILLVLKIIVALNAVEMLDIDLDNYEFLLDSLNPESIDMSSIMDYNAAVQFSSELLLIELMHRVIVCLYEAMCTSRGPAGNQGGATPGKFIMGLRVIKCHQLIPAGGNRVLITPGGNLGFGWALLRSFLKNLSVATMFPLCISLTLDPNTRTVHDFLSNSVVVQRQ
eukprot:TRINITY_DN2573_c1_g1_i4.p1 TRINITY_DN2573_c1_g1~~TRINITY_DN2573_c1_g1_i4.p1  ORF type:complete len:313 (-),score=39.07 TRINITY_DN2573_c1_g1_i4:263-1201(-)